MSNLTHDFSDISEAAAIHDIAAATALDIYGQQMQQYSLLSADNESQLGQQVNTCIGRMLCHVSFSSEGINRLSDLLVEQLYSRRKGIGAKNWDLPASPHEVEDQLLTLLDTLGVLLHLSEAKSEHAESLRMQLQKIFLSLSLGRQILTALVEELAAHPSLPKEDVLALKSGLRHYSRLREKLVVSNLRLVYKVANRYTHTGVNLDDLIQEGNIGLIKAADRFNFSRGFKFSTYAYWTIQNVIKSSIQQRYHLIARPAYLQEKLSIVRKAEASLQREHNALPSRKDVAKASGIDEKTLSRIDAFPRSGISLNQPIQGQADNNTYDEVLDLQTSTYDTIDDSESAKSFFARLSPHLTAREAQVIKLRYGIGCREEYTLEAVATMLQVSTERVRQIQKNALKRMQALVSDTRLSLSNPS